MSEKDFFPEKPELNPTIYAYEDTHPQYKGLLKIGFTNIDVEQRVRQQYPTLRPGDLPYKIVYSEPAIRNDGSTFSDHDVHRFLKKQGIKNPNGEWFECNANVVQNAVLNIRHNKKFTQSRTLDFVMRPEQQEAVDKTVGYIGSFKKENPDQTPHFLWNAKMRFGKTFAAYQLAKKMGWTKILVLTFKPAVQSAWEEDLNTHVDFDGWQFISKKSMAYEDADTSKPFVCFGSFQDYLGKNSAGGIKAKNEWVHEINWDCVIFDEYHYGAWRESAKELFEAEDKKEMKFGEGEGIELLDDNTMPITTSAYLYLSGTPFRAIESGEFIEEQIYNWTYSDEQNAKEKWVGNDNPYSALPQMVMLTYQLPDAIREIAMGGEYNEFDLNVFFSASGEGDNATFKYKDEVQKWLELIRGEFQETTLDNLKLGAKKPPFPFSDSRLKNILSHTFWFL